MQVTIEINGRQALPVRAIPLLTDWRGLSPDALAQILADDSDNWPSFKGLTAHQLNPDGSTEQRTPRWWASWIVDKLQSTSDTIKAHQTSNATGKRQWRCESLAQLPARVFVWRDEFELAHAHEYGPEGRRARSNPKGFDPSAHVLDFNPQPDPDIAPLHMVMEGFIPAVTAAPALVMANSASSAPSWSLTKPKRFRGYAAPLYRLLAAAQREGKPCPSARDVLEAWRIETPAEIVKVLTDGLDYYDAKGDTKPADLDAIHKAIKRMTNAL